MWPSTTKYFSPFFSYTLPSAHYGAPLRHRLSSSLVPRSSVQAAPRPSARPASGSYVAGRVQCLTYLLRRCGRQVKAQIVGGVLRVGDEDSPVVGVDHPAVVRGHVLLELGLVEVAGILAEGLGDLVVDDVHPPDRVDADHRWQRHHPHVRLGGHHLRHDLAYLVVHQREPAPAGCGAVGLERALGGLERGHWASSFGTSRLSADRIPANRLLAASRPSSKRGGLASGCDHSGWS